MTITIISVGTKPRPAHSELLTTYLGRLPRHLSVQWRYVKHGVGDTAKSMQNEAEKILKSIPEKTYVVLLDETGTLLTSEQFATAYIAPQRDITFIIGGAYGVTNAVKQRANELLSLSKLVLPHQLVRLVLAEQIYRSYTIDSGHPYHHA